MKIINSGKCYKFVLSIIYRIFHVDTQKTLFTFNRSFVLLIFMLFIRVWQTTCDDNNDADIKSNKNGRKKKFK